MRITQPLKSVLVAVFGLILTTGFMQSASQPQRSQEQAAPASDQAEVTLIGCLVKIDTGAWRPGTSDTIPAGPARPTLSSGFALKDAARVAEPPQTGAVDTRSELEFSVSKGDVKVDRFAGHQVEVKGVVDGHRIEVTAIRSLSESCPPRG